MGHFRPSEEKSGSRPLDREASAQSMWLQLKKRFGLLEIFLFIGSIFCIVGVLILLSLLWIWGHGVQTQPRGNLLTILALRDWLPQFITILTALLRFALAAQISSCCMMLASLSLGRNAIRRPRDRHDVGVLQEATPGPSSLLLPFAKAATQGLDFQCFLLAALLFVVSILSQFSSTMLLSDFRSATLLHDSRNFTLNVTTKALSDYAVLTTRPWAYPVFAEQAEGRDAVIPHDTHPGLFDTGSISRAYLPLSLPERIRLHEYRGFGTVLTSHTMCFPPDISNLTTYVHISYSSDSLFIQEEIRSNGTIPAPRNYSTLYSQYSSQQSWNLTSLSADNQTYNITPCSSTRIGGVSIYPLSEA